ncbi:MAG: GGDEF domain-containing protein [Acidobacteriota bacterium]
MGPIVPRIERRQDAPQQRGVWGQVWKSPDPFQAEAGFTGEYLVAGLRLLIVVVLIYVPVRQWQLGEIDPYRNLLLGSVGLALIEALLVYSAVQRNWGRSWIGWVSSLLDVTLVTWVLSIYLFLDDPLAATNSTIVYPVYFLAIGATSLRYDSRICLMTGLLATVQYAALVIYAVQRWQLAAPGVHSTDYGSFDVATQVGRLVLLLGATLLAVTVVVRAREASDLSMRDRLTGLLNRGIFDARLHEEVKRAHRSGKPISVAMIDVDHFKAFNDTFGHEAGDEALRAVSAQLVRSFRATDVVARYGGEEFAVILPGMSMRHAHQRMEAVRAAVEDLRIAVRGSRELATVTVSGGVAVWPTEGSDIQQVVAMADQRLYRAKQGGRNRVICPRQPEPPLPGGGTAREAAQRISSEIPRRILEEAKASRGENAEASGEGSEEPPREVSEGGREVTSGSGIGASSSES